jgi:hypothetical protein
MDPDQADLMGVDDKGKWMPFAIRMDQVVAIKLTSDDEDQPVFGCTTVFTEFGDTYILDTAYTEFETKFLVYHNSGSTTNSIKTEPNL